MSAEPKFILDPISLREFVSTYKLPSDEDLILDTLRDGLADGAFIAEVTVIEDKPGKISHDLLVTGLNGKIAFLGAATDPDSFVSKLTIEVLEHGKNTLEAESVVLFRKSIVDSDEITAVFPFEEGIRNRDAIVSCYAHVGQHSTCHLDWVTENTRAATPEEYADLKRELESAPFEYKFIVLEDLRAIGREEVEFAVPKP